MTALIILVSLAGCAAGRQPASAAALSVLTENLLALESECATFPREGSGAEHDAYESRCDDLSDVVRNAAHDVRDPDVAAKALWDALSRSKQIRLCDFYIATTIGKLFPQYRPDQRTIRLVIAKVDASRHPRGEWEQTTVAMQASVEQLLESTRYARTNRVLDAEGRFNDSEWDRFKAWIATKTS